MDIHSRLLEIVKEKGPILPSQANVEIGQNILITSALLAELASEGHVRISHLKVGGSPLYYLPGQEDQLQSFASKLHEKEKMAYDLLKQKKILKDSEQTPVMRVALRQISDFAIPVEVEVEEHMEIFWKWYLLDEKESKKFIRDILAIRKEELPKRAEKEESGWTEIKQTEASEENATIREERQKEKVKAIQKKEIKKEKAIEEKPDSFVDKLTNLFNEKGIEVVEKNILRKNEVDFILMVPSPVGKILHYCRAKNKKKINDADLSQAYVQGQTRKLPVLFITTGELTKKTSAMLSNEFKHISVVKI